jgi:hypothetical protein
LVRGILTKHACGASRRCAAAPQVAVITLFNQTFTLTKPGAKGIVSSPVFFKYHNKVYRYGIKRR